MGEAAVSRAQLAQLPWPVLASVGSAVIVNPALESLLGVHDPSDESLLRRFEIARYGGKPLEGDDLPWRRAARGESFEEDEDWFDQETGTRHTLHLRCQPWLDSALIAVESFATQPIYLRMGELAGSIGTALLRSSEPSGVAHAIVEDVAKAIGADAVFLLLTEPDGKRLRLTASVGLTKEVMAERVSIPIDAPMIVAEAARTRELQEVARIEDEVTYRAGAERLLGLGLHSVVAIPLIAMGELVGVLGLARRHHGKLNPFERRILSGVAVACALGLRQARMREQERIDAERLRTLRQAALLIDTALPLRELLRRLVEQACELTRARYGALGVLNADGSGLEDFIHFGIAEDVAERIGHLPEGHGLLGAVVREGRAIRTADIRNDPRACGFPRHHPSMTSFLGIPLRIGRETFGNLYVTEKQDNAEFTEEDERLLELFGAQSALAIRYARQMKVAEEANKELGHVRDEFSAIVAHDLRTPLSAILLQVEDLRRRAGEEGSVPVSAAALNRIRRSGYRVSEMANDLMERGAPRGGTTRARPQGRLAAGRTCRSRRPAPARARGSGRSSSRSSVHLLRCSPIRCGSSRCS